VKNGAKNPVVVVSSNKIVKDLATGFQRQREYPLALESTRVRVAYKVPASDLKTRLTINGGNPFGNEGRLRVIIINEALGY
jgi:hypothetical protein